MNAFAVIECRAFQIGFAHGVNVFLNGISLVGSIDNAFVGTVEAEKFHYFKLAFGQLRCFFVRKAVNVEMIVSVAAALKQKFAVVPWKKHKRVLRFHIFLISLFEYQVFFLARCGIIRNKLHVVLVAIELEDVNCLLVGRPTDIGEISVGRIGSFKVNRAIVIDIVNAYIDLVALFSRHGIFVRLYFRNT